MQHAPSLVLVAWLGLLAAGCTWVAPLLIVFMLSVVVAGREYLR